MSSNLFTLSNPVFSSYAFYGTVVLVKTFGMSLLTSAKRMINGVFANEEDAKAFGARKVTLDNDSIERVRRNHLNDLENIPTFLLIGLLYVATNPTPNAALWHFRVFTAARIIHTLAYQLAIPQPVRALSFSVGLTVCLSMAYQVLVQTQF